MYSEGGFTAYLTDYKPFVKESVPYFLLKLKVVSNTPFQTLMKSIDDLPDRPRKYGKYFEGEIAWDSLEFKDLGFNTEVEVESMDKFDAILKSVKCVRKIKGDSEEFVYTISLVKEVSSDNLDKVILSSYLNVTEPDENGKERKKELLFQFTYIID